MVPHLSKLWVTSHQALMERVYPEWERTVVWFSDDLWNVDRNGTETLVSNYCVLLYIFMLDLPANRFRRNATPLSNFSLSIASLSNKTITDYCGSATFVPS